MSGYLFTYGTLQPGRVPAEIAQTAKKLQPVGKGFVRGVLYDLGDYPGAILDPSSQRTITGTVFQLPDEEGVLRRLDEYEGFDSSAPGGSLFIRAMEPVMLASGGAVECWVYVYNRDAKRARILESGVY